MRRFTIRSLAPFAVAALLAAMLGCVGADSTPTPEPTATPSPTPLATSTPEPSPTPTQTPAPTPTPLVVEEWATYGNQESGASFDYPTTWDGAESSQGDVFFANDPSTDPNLAPTHLQFVRQSLEGMEGVTLEAVVETQSAQVNNADRYELVSVEPFTTSSGLEARMMRIETAGEDPQNPESVAQLVYVSANEALALSLTAAPANFQNMEAARERIFDSFTVVEEAAEMGSSTPEASQGSGPYGGQ